MKRNHFNQLLNDFRVQLEVDMGSPSERSPVQLAKAEDFLLQIEGARTNLPELQRILPMLRQSVRTYYTSVHHRSLPRQFILHDLELLQNSFIEETGQQGE